MNKCDSDDFSKDIERKNSTNIKDETEQIETSTPSDSKSTKLNVEKEKSAEDISNVGPSISNNNNANSAFEISTFYV